MSNDLSFLSNITLKEVPVKVAKTSSKYKAPEDADLRVYASGKIFPSQEFVDKYNLEYGPREEVVEEGKTTAVVVGNGLDIFKSSDWPMVEGMLPQEMLFITVVPKNEPKVDLWGSCKYDDKGNPKSSVMTQGSNSFAKNNLVGYIADVLGVSWEAVEYVDLVMATEHPVRSQRGVYHLPKTITSGPRKGHPDVIRRENIDVFALVLAEKEEAPVQEPAVGQEVADGPGEDWAEKMQK